MSATPATWNEGGCEVVPRLPRENGAASPRAQTAPKRATPCHDCHACHAKARWMSVCATPATWNEGGCNVLPRLPRKMARRHRAPKPHPSAPPHAMSATPATRKQGGCQFVPHLPRKTKVDASLCHACHAKWRGVTARPNHTQARHPMPWVPRENGAASPRAQTAPKRATPCHDCHACHAKARWMSVCATPATWNEGGCNVLPRLPRKMARRHRAPKPHPSAPPHAMSATPATRKQGGCQFVPHLPRRNEGGCKVVPRLPRKMARRHRAPKPHPSAPPHAMSATPATQNDGRCEIVPRLPREIKVDVRLCHACHVKRRWMSGCATPAVCEVSVKLLYYCMWSLCVCVDHLHRCKTSLFSWRLCFVFYQFCIIIAGGTGPLWIPVPTKLFHNGGSGDWSPPCTCTNFHFRQWRPAKPSTSMSFGFSIFHYGLCCIWTFFRTSMSTGFNPLYGFRNLNYCRFRQMEQLLLARTKTEFFYIGFLAQSSNFSCQTLGDCLCTFDAFHISNSIRYFWASVSLIPLSDKVVWALRGKPF